MATNGKPTTSFTINYGTLDAAVAERALAPVFIAPRYALHSFEDGYENAFLGKFDADNNKLKGVAWPSRKKNSILDINSGCLYVNNAKIVLNDEELTGTVSATTPNVITMDVTVKNIDKDTKVPTALRDNEVRVGDLVKIVVNENTIKYANVVDIKPEYTEATINDPIANEDNTGTYNSMTVSGTFTGNTAATYMLKAIENGVANSVRVMIVSLGGDEGYKETLKFESGALSIGNFGLEVSMQGDKSNIKANDVFIITCSPKTIESYSKVYLDQVLPATPENEKYSVFFASNHLTTGFIPVSSTSWSASKSNVTVNDAVRTTIDGNSYQIQEADLYLTYRELITEDSLELVTNSSENIADYVGIAHPDNPMGMFYACASLVPDAFFYMCSVAGTTDEDYTRAINYVSKFENVYSILTYKQVASTQNSIISTINKYSQKSIAQYKSSWFSSTIDKELNVYDKDGNGNALIGKIVDGCLIVSSPANLIENQIKSGDIANIILDYDETTNKYTTVSYTIDLVENEQKAVLSNASDVSLSQVYITRLLNASEYADALASEAARLNNHRLQYVVSDQLNWGDFENVDKIYAAATLATYRCALPPHAPMNELILPGFKIVDTLKWSDSDYEKMNNGGCWVLYNDLNNNAVVYHQITTKTDGTIAEENSAVANGDAIVRRLRQSVKNLASGKVNVTGELLNLIKAQLIGEIEYIRSIPYSDLYGPQILDYKLNRLSQVDGNKKSIMCDLDLELPLPLQNGDFYFNLI